jgi:hypothetical protein
MQPYYEGIPGIDEYRVLPEDKQVLSCKIVSICNERGYLMKIIFLLILITGICFALDPDAGPSAQETANLVAQETNDWDSDTEIYRYSTVSGWSYAFDNPSVEPRGMDFDPSLNIWEIDAASHTLYVFDIAGTVSESWTLSELPAGNACGCSVFPFGADQGVIIGGYSFLDYYFYSFDGSTLEYLGAAPVPQSINNSYGISWSDFTQSFYWIYKDPGSNFRLCEFTVEFEVTLDQSTWGAVKAGF